MKLFSSRIILFIVISILLMSCQYVLANTVTSNTDISEETSTLTLTGVVTHNTLEGGFYEVNGYMLKGDMDFSTYFGSKVKVVGEKDTSPSIQMRKAIKVETIETIE